MRTTETFYFNHGYVKFMKVKGEIIYKIFKWVINGMDSYLLEEGRVKDESHLKELLNLGSVMT